MKGFDLTSPNWNKNTLTEETTRVFDVCEGCRRCFNLCPSFGTLFDITDQQDGDVTKLSIEKFSDVVNQCFYCKMCWNHCPYTPPHKYEIDFPHLMAAWKTQPEVRKNQGFFLRLRDRILVNTDLIGRLGTSFPRLSNFIRQTKWVRYILHKALGIHKDRILLPFTTETLQSWFIKSKNSSQVSGNNKIALFGTCVSNYQSREIGESSIRVLQKNGVEVAYPEQQCCGMPYFDTGDLQTMKEKANANITTLRPWIEDGYVIVVPTPSCSLMLKREYPYLFPSDPATVLANNTYDICEYLMILHRKGELLTDFVKHSKNIAYQIPCHLRDQNIGFKSRDLMSLTGAKVSTIERCSGHDGSWGVKSEYFDMSMKMASRLGKDIEDSAPDVIASDCPLSALQITQSTGKQVLHPIQIIEKAYGL